MGSTYLFRHAVFRAAATQSIPQPVLVRLHRLAYDVLVAVEPYRGRELALANHLEMAARHSEGDAPDLRGKELKHLKAACLEFERDFNSDAYAETCLRIAYHPSATEGDRRNAFDKAFFHLVKKGNSARLKEIFPDVISLHESTSDFHGQIQAWISLGNARITDADNFAAADAFMRAIELAEQHDHQQGLAIALGDRGIALKNLGQYAEAVSCYERSASIGKKLGQIHIVLQNLINSASLLINLGEYERAIEQLSDAEAMADVNNDDYGRLLAKANLGVCHLRLGHPHLAFPFFESALRVASETRSFEPWFLILIDCAKCHGELGQHKAAAESLRRAEELAKRLDGQYFDACLAAAESDLSRMRGEFDRAIHQARTGLKIFEDLNVHHEVAKTGLELAELYLLLGRDNEAQEAFERVQSYAAHEGLVPELAGIESGLGVLSLRAQDFEKAFGLALSAHEHFQATDIVHSVSYIRCLISLKACYEARGEPNAATAFAEDAAEAFDRIKESGESRKDIELAIREIQCSLKL